MHKVNPLVLKTRYLILTDFSLTDGLKKSVYLQATIETFAATINRIPVYDTTGGSIDHFDFEARYLISFHVPECNLAAFDDYFGIKPTEAHKPIPF